MDADFLQRLCHDFGVPELAEQAITSLVPCISVRPEQSADHSVGAHRIGGEPDLPEGFEWPTWNGVPQSFLAQFNLADLIGHACSADLPERGLLSFFYDAEQSTWGFDPEDRGSWRVEHFGQEGLVRRPFPKDLPEHGRFRPCRVESRDGLRLDGLPEEFFKLQEATFEAMEERLWEQTRERPDASHLLGCPIAIQGSVTRECALASNGRFAGEPKGWSGPKAEALLATAHEWTLLFQLGTEDEANMMWDDVGALYFCIKKADLAAGNFRDVWMVLQCH